MAGMEPSVSLNYTSGGGNGLVGLGWSIGGLSQNNRCATTLAQDGFIDSVEYDSNRFCLDDQRLVAIPDDSCADGRTAIYRTEIDSFYKIEYFGSTADSSYFKIRTPSSQTKYYGLSANSRIEAQGKVLASLWAVNRDEDAAGNYMTYGNKEDNLNEFSRIKRINYTGIRTLGGLSPSAISNRSNKTVRASGAEGCVTSL